MTTQPGRNDPCPCGSGKKYKKCCLQNSADATPKTNTTSTSPPHPSSIMFLLENDDLEELSNGVIDLIDQGLLDEADKQCRVLRERHPGMIDWMERLAAVYEARKDWAQAVDYYRQAADFAEKDPDGYDKELIEDLRQTANRLEKKLDSNLS